MLEIRPFGFGSATVITAEFEVINFPLALVNSDSVVGPSMDAPKPILLTHWYPYLPSAHTDTPKYTITLGSDINSPLGSPAHRRALS